ncbi:MAG: EamA family transporter RarD [Bacteriovoracaceae bacterium]|nr:EamA family transporter RarD [Bacteriovoracaceae bacterium]
MNFSSAHLGAITAFSLWGVFPLYWKIFAGEGAWDLFGQRLLWSFITLLLILVFKKKLGSLTEIWNNKRTRYMLMLSAIFISSNWLIYIYAVNIGRVLEASMGYFLNPLINVFMGWLLLKEEIRPTQWPAIILAIISIVMMGLQTDLAHFPWVALSLSITFALYGLIRKVTHVGSMEGLTFETCFILGPVLIYWYFFQPTSPSTLYYTLPGWKFFVLSLSGVITCIPLILFAYSAKRLKLQTLGFIQYLSPSFKFLCGWLVLKESLSHAMLQTFVLIWVALLWYTLESFYFVRKNKKTPGRY